MSQTPVVFVADVKRTMTKKRTKKKEDAKEKKKKPSGFVSKLRAKCKNCTSETIKVYSRNARRLYRLTNEEGEVPSTSAWLKEKKLFEAYKKLPLKTRRHLSVAAVKVQQAVGGDGDRWQLAMLKDAHQYQLQRSKNQKSDVEKERWPKGGYLAVKKASQEQLKRIRHIISEKPTLSGLYRYQIYIVLKLFSSSAPFRNTFATLQVGEHKEGNYINIPRKGNISFVIRKHKSSKQLGPRTVSIGRAGTMALRKFLKYREKVVDHDWFLSSKRGGRMTRAALGKALHRYTKQLTNKAFGSRLIRVLAATEKKDEIAAVADLSHKMLHGEGGKTTSEYVRK